MQNKFGLKDFVLFAFIITLGVLVVLAMFQKDREWGLIQGLEIKLAQQEQTLARVESAAQKPPTESAGMQQIAEKLDRLTAAQHEPIELLATVSAKLDSIKAGSAEAEQRLQARIEEIRKSSEERSKQLESQIASNAANGNKAGPRDESWARPGFPVLWQPDRTYATDPRMKPGYKQGGEFTEIFEVQTKVLTPNISQDGYARRIQEMVMESLGDFDPKTLKLQGLLAEAWQVDPEGMWLRARLRPGVRFSDGTPITAEDVRWTFHDYIMNEQNDAERDRSVMRDSIKEVHAIDERTVEFVFVQRLFTNVQNALSMFILPKHIYSTLTPSQINQSTGLLVGSGPFKLKDFSVTRQWSPPADIVLERNEQYWSNKPALAGLRYKGINEEVARLNAFNKGEADMITPSAPQFVSKSEDLQWQAKTQFLKWVNMRSGYAFIAWNGGERNGKLTPFHDRRVRLAMTYALDREKMIQNIWKGLGVVAKGNMSPEAPGANKEIQPYPYDVAKAKALLKEAGWEDRNGDGQLEDASGNEFEFEYSFAGGSEIAEKIAKFAKDSYESIGIRVRLRSADWTVYQDFMKKRDFDALTLVWSNSLPESDPKQIFHSDSIKNQGDNFVQWASKEADQCIDEGRKEMDFDKRQVWWQRLEKVLHEEQPYTFVRVPPWTRFVSKKFDNVNPYPKGLQPDEFFMGGAGAVPLPGN